ncbi:ATP-binding cassette domain-containing protein [Mycoplasma elephantis]|uniref:ATP-binding cassette domain-containing protein n=1 Tax=Mycoplasma elephantis TaxID=114882 RepID=UPI0004862F36|nr:ATP-binding cassette domain-containing protein [Mycoplasma elephantis]
MQNNNRKTILSVKNLKKYFINRGLINKAVDDLTFDLYEGEILGLIGESGSGKTTVGRTLLRLYDQFNGFVTLDGKIISGQKLNRERVKHLRKNMQMIFQDPHASLNGQKNIYSILKEPLIVNGLAKSLVKDLFSDWKYIKENFRYTFEAKANKLKLKNLQSINELAKEFFDNWKNRLKQFKVTKNDNFEDKFDELFRYLEAKQEMESIIVNNIYANTTELTRFYNEKQQDFRNNIIDNDEKELKEAREFYLKTKLLTKFSEEALIYIDKLKQLEKEEKKFSQVVKEFKINNKNAYKNFIQEFKSEINLLKASKNISEDLDSYAHFTKNIYLNKWSIKSIKYIMTKVRYINIEDITKLIEDLKQYNAKFYEENLNFKFVLKHNKKVKNILARSYNFDFSNYRAISQVKRKEIHDKEHEYEIEKNKFKDLIEKEKNNTSVFKTKQDVEKAKIKWLEAKEFNKKEIVGYIQANIEKNKKLKEQIDNEYSLYKDLKQKQTYLNKLFDDNFKEFLITLKQKLQEKTKDFKEIKLEISKFETIVQEKKQTLKSFDIEVKYLNKDIRSLHLLLGINKAFSKKFIKWYRKIEHYIIYPIAKYKIKNLLIKNKIYKSLEDVGLLKQFAYRYPHEFSGGQRQRIVIARALISDPKVIVADEPIASLDISIQAQIVNLLKELCQEKNIGLIFIAHDLSMVEYIADRILIMHLGKVVESGNTTKIYKMPIHPYTKNLFKAIPKISNANEKFKNISFELNYLIEQEFPNVCETFEIEPGHFIYGTKEQLKKWLKK